VRDVAILGPGAVGGFLAAALERGGAEVTAVARPETADAIERGGIRVASVLLGDLHARPAVATQLERPVDALVVATKAMGLAAALDRIHAGPRLVVPVLNGLDHLAVLRERFGDRAVAAAIRIEAIRRSPTHVVHTSRFLRVDMAGEGVDGFAALLVAAGVPARVMDSEPAVMWGKLVRLCGLALTSSASDRLLGEIRDDQGWRARLERCVREAAAVAAADGARVRPESVMAELDGAHDSLGSSLQRDLAAGNETELDAIAGSVLRAASRHGLACPTIAELAGSLTARSR
jgi:2-dehydropantoate 2-reductase